MWVKNVNGFQMPKVQAQRVAYYVLDFWPVSL